MSEGVDLSTTSTFTYTDDQLAVINHNLDTGHALIIAGPGSGKTTTLHALVAGLIKKRVDPKKIRVLVFNRDISQKIDDKLTNTHGAVAPTASTIHSFVLQQTKKHQPSIIEGRVIAEVALGEYGLNKIFWTHIASRLKGRHGLPVDRRGRYRVHELQKLIGDRLQRYRFYDEEFADDEMFQKFMSEYRFVSDAYTLMFFDEFAKRFLDVSNGDPFLKDKLEYDVLFVDEFQDLNPVEHLILEQMHEAGVTIFSFGDDDQAVNLFRGAHAKHMQDYMKKFGPKVYQLKRDKRCPKEILDLADSFMVPVASRFDKPTGHSKNPGDTALVAFDSDIKEVEGVAEIVKKYLDKHAEYDGENPQILILAPRNGVNPSVSRIDEFVEQFKKVGVTDTSSGLPDDTFVSPYGLAIQSLMDILASSKNSANLAAYLAMTYPGLHKKVVQVVDESEEKGEPVNFYEACFRLPPKQKTDLEQLMARLDSIESKAESSNLQAEDLFALIDDRLDGRKDVQSQISQFFDFFAEKAAVKDDSILGRDLLTRSYSAWRESNFRIKIKRVHVTTYRKSKGLDADLVITTSTDNKEFRADDAHRRLLYVAATRSKSRLVLTYATRRSGARRFDNGRAKNDGDPRFSRTSILPTKLQPVKYTESWQRDWITKL